MKAAARNTAFLAAQILNPHRKKGTRAYRAEDFLPKDWQVPVGPDGEPLPPLTEEEKWELQAEKMRSIARRITRFNVTGGSRVKDHI